MSNNQDNGNAEANPDASEMIFGYGYVGTRGEHHVQDADMSKRRIESAHAAPLRNCDVGTAEEQYRRWIHFCEKHLHMCDNCECNSHVGCTFTFENMPYHEGGAK